jgi:hypothetical protein
MGFMVAPHKKTGVEWADQDPVFKFAEIVRLFNI